MSLDKNNCIIFLSNWYASWPIVYCFLISIAYHEIDNKMYRQTDGGRIFAYNWRFSKNINSTDTELSIFFNLFDTKIFTIEFYRHRAITFELCLYIFVYLFILFIFISASCQFWPLFQNNYSQISRYHLRQYSHMWLISKIVVIANCVEFLNAQACLNALNAWLHVNYECVLDLIDDWKHADLQIKERLA